MILVVRILAAAGLLVALLVGLVIREDVARAGGREVRLAIGAIDPRSLLSGHYVDLQFVDEVPAGISCRRTIYLDGQEKWVLLQAAGDRHVFAGGVVGDDFQPPPGAVMVRGQANCLGGQEGRVGLDIGIDRFHADQDEAQAIQAALQRREGDPAFAIVSVGRDGRARLKGLQVGGKRTELTWW
jgi:uncharacterized membrane-anchored protein